MAIDKFISYLAQYWPVVLTAAALIYVLRNKYNRGLNRYPGPTLASYTDWWRFFDVLGRDAERTHIQLHKELGDIVRLGPNILSFADPKALKVIYGLNKGFTKSEFYPVQNAISEGRRLQSLFSTTDEDYHARYRRCVNSAFSMSSLVSYEPLVDSTTAKFLEQTQITFCDTQATCNFAQWLQYYAFDVIGELTWSKRLGFIDRQEDVDGIVEFLGQFLSYAGPVGQMPILDLFFQKNPLKMCLERWGLRKSVFPVTLFAQKRSQERHEEMRKLEDGKFLNGRENIDLLSKFIKAQQDHPEFMTDKQVLSASVSMVFAGSETTAISLSSVFYFLLKHPHCYERLMKELDDGAKRGIIQERANGVVSWSESQQLPYLDACIQESFRLHPAPGLLFERVVPRQGIDILGEHIPGGVIVGCNPWVLHRRPEVFGEDVEVYRPERWLEAPPTKLKEMKATMFQFGAGARTCIGKNISLLEIYKLVPSFLRRFETRLEDPDQVWKTHNAWFVRQLDFNTKFEPRLVHDIK